MRFRRRHARGRPPHPDVLTPAEWRVLAELREGRSNAEIAARLDVSVNTVRTHVSSMLAKLELRDRAALAGWSGEPAPATDTALSRPERTLLAGPVAWLRDSIATLKPAVVAGAVVLTGVAIVGVAFAASRARNEDREAAPPAAVATTPEPSETPTPLAAPRPSPADNDKPTPTPLPRFTPSPGARTIRGLSLTPRPSAPDVRRSLPPAPPETFSPWNGTDVVLYDIEAMTELNLGMGGFAAFSLDGRSLLWVSGNVLEAGDEGQRLSVLDVATGNRRVLGPARYATVVDDDHVALMLPGTNS